MFVGTESVFVVEMKIILRFCNEITYLQYSVVGSYGGSGSSYSSALAVQLT